MIKDPEDSQETRRPSLDVRFCSLNTVSKKKYSSEAERPN